MWNLKFAYKNLKKSFSITLINILGFSLGLCIVFFLIRYLQHEYSFDSFHKDKEQMFRVTVKSFHENNFEGETYVYTSEMGASLKADFPEVEEYVTISYPKTDIFYIGNNPVKIEDYIYATPSFFDMFSFGLKEGNEENVLKDPYTLVLTEKQASKMFAGLDPVGRQLRLNNELYTITGVAEDPPENSHIQFSMLVSFSTRYRQQNVYMGWYGGNQYTHYVKLASGASLDAFREKVPAFMWKYINREYEKYNAKDEMNLQPFTEIHLHHNPYSASLRRSMLVFSFIAVMLMAVVIINFINLFIANSGIQLKTMGIIKIHGAGKIRMIKYLFTEISLLIAFSVLIAAILVRLFHPYFEQLAGKAIPVITEDGWFFTLILVLVLLSVSFAASLFPSFYISSVKPTTILKTNVVAGKQNFHLKNGLVVFQFFISILLIISAIAINNQNRYIQKFNPGYDKENVLILPLQSMENQQKQSVIKQEILKLGGVKKVSAVSEVPYNGVTSNGYFPEGKTSPLIINVIDVDEDFLSLMNIPLLQGENFSVNKKTDKNAYLINESFIREMGWEEPVGKIIHRNTDHQVIGVVEDFNFASLRSVIKPLIITNNPSGRNFHYLLLKISGEKISTIVREIMEKWKEISPNTPFEYSFLDQKFEQVYRAELSIQKLLNTFSGLTIFIALLGLLGLSKYSIDSRIKEIGIRKVNGATVNEILILLNSNYVVLIVAAFVVASPIAWYVVHKWLENFAFKTNMSWWIFALAGILSLGIALLTVSFQSWRAATRNPVEALRYE